MGIIPKGAKCVYRGRVVEVWKWRQRMFDGSYADFERVRRPYTVQVIATVGRKVLITKERQPSMRGVRTGLFGGQIDKGESPLHAAKRELLEEGGLASDDWELLKVSTPMRNTMDWKVYLYVARDCRKVAEPHPDPGEKISVRRLDFGAFIEDSRRLNRTMLAEIRDMSFDKRRMSDFRNRLFKTGYVAKMRHGRR